MHSTSQRITMLRPCAIGHAGKDEVYKSMKVTCIIATVPDIQGSQVTEEMQKSMDLSTKLPADGENPPQLVLGMCQRTAAVQTSSYP